MVPTDFSASAENAMLYAGNLAKNTNASVLLLHVYQVPVGMNDMPVMIVSADELKQNAEAGLRRAKKLLQKNFESLEIKTESRLGDVVEELKDVCEKEDPFTLVVGKHGTTGIERVLFGSTSLSIIRHTTYPVIVVPDRSSEVQIENIALAIDSAIESTPIQKIKNIIVQLKAQLHLIHVQSEKGSTLNTDQLCAELNAKCQTIYDHEFVRGIENYIQENSIDMLMILPHRHNIIERLFYKTHTPELLQKVSIPILSIREDE